MLLTTIPAMPPDGVSHTPKVVRPVKTREGESFTKTERANVNMLVSSFFFLFLLFCLQRLPSPLEARYSGGTVLHRRSCRCASSIPLVVQWLMCAACYSLPSRQCHPMTSRIQRPGVISGTFTLAHKIDEDSPLHGLTEDNITSTAWRKTAISVVFVGRDDVYYDDLHCIMRCMVFDSGWLGRVRLGLRFFLFFSFSPCASSFSRGYVHLIWFDSGLIHSLMTHSIKGTRCWM
jgi:hypothetical protein